MDISSGDVCLLGALPTPPSAIRTRSEARELHAQHFADDGIDAKLRAIKKARKYSSENTSPHSEGDAGLGSSYLVSTTESDFADETKGQSEMRDDVSGFLVVAANLRSAHQALALSATETTMVKEACDSLLKPIMAPLDGVMDSCQVPSDVACDEEQQDIYDEACPNDTESQTSDASPPMSEQGSALATTLHALAEATQQARSAKMALHAHFDESGRTTPPQFHLVSEEIQAVKDADQERKADQERPGDTGGRNSALLAGLDMDAGKVSKWGDVFEALESFAVAAGGLLHFAVQQRLSWRRVYLFVGWEHRETPPPSVVRAHTDQVHFLRSPRVWAAFIESLCSSGKSLKWKGSCKSQRKVTCLTLALVTRLLDPRVVDTTIRHIASKLAVLSQTALVELCSYMVALGKPAVSEVLKETLGNRLSKVPFPYLTEESNVIGVRALVDSVGCQIEATRMELTVYHYGELALRDVTPGALLVMDDVSTLLGGPGSEVPMWKTGLEGPSSLFATDICDQLLRFYLLRTLVAVADGYPLGEIKGNLAPSHFQTTTDEYALPPPGVGIGDAFFVSYDMSGGVVTEPVKRADYSALAEFPPVPGGAVVVVCFRYESRRTFRCTSPECSFQTNAFTCNWNFLCMHGLSHASRISQARNVGVATALSYGEKETLTVSNDPPVVGIRNRTNDSSEFAASSR